MTQIWLGKIGLHAVAFRTSDFRSDLFYFIFFFCNVSSVWTDATFFVLRTEIAAVAPLKISLLFLVIVLTFLPWTHRLPLHVNCECWHQPNRIKRIWTVNPNCAPRLAVWTYLKSSQTKRTKGVNEERGLGEISIFTTRWQQIAFFF